MSRLTPVNLLEAKRAFFKSGCKEEPKFEYSVALQKMKKDVFKYGAVSYELFDLARAILEEVRERYDNVEENPTGLINGNSSPGAYHQLGNAAATSGLQPGTSGSSSSLQQGGKLFGGGTPGAPAAGGSGSSSQLQPGVTSTSSHKKTPPSWATADDVIDDHDNVDEDDNEEERRVPEKPVEEDPLKLLHPSGGSAYGASLRSMIFVEDSPRTVRLLEKAAESMERERLEKEKAEAVQKNASTSSSTSNAKIGGDGEQKTGAVVDTKMLNNSTSWTTKKEKPTSGATSSPNKVVVTRINISPDVDMLDPEAATSPSRLAARLGVKPGEQPFVVGGAGGTSSTLLNGAAGPPGSSGSSPSRSSNYGDNLVARGNTNNTHSGKNFNVINLQGPVADRPNDSSVPIILPPSGPDFATGRKLTHAGPVHTGPPPNFTLVKGHLSSASQNGQVSGGGQHQIGSASGQQQQLPHASFLHHYNSENDTHSSSASSLDLAVIGGSTTSNARSGGHTSNNGADQQHLAQQHHGTPNSGGASTSSSAFVPPNIGGTTGNIVIRSSSSSSSVGGSSSTSNLGSNQNAAAPPNNPPTAFLHSGPTSSGPAATVGSMVANQVQSITERRRKRELRDTAPAVGAGTTSSVSSFSTAGVDRGAGVDHRDRLEADREYLMSHHQQISAGTASKDRATDLPIGPPLHHVNASSSSMLKSVGGRKSGRLFSDPTPHRDRLLSEKLAGDTVSSSSSSSHLAGGASAATTSSSATMLNAASSDRQHPSIGIGAGQGGQQMVTPVGVGDAALQRSGGTSSSSSHNMINSRMIPELMSNPNARRAPHISEIMEKSRNRLLAQAPQHFQESSINFNAGTSAHHHNVFNSMLQGGAGGGVGVVSRVAGNSGNVSNYPNHFHHDQLASTLNSGTFGQAVSAGVPNYMQSMGLAEVRPDLSSWAPVRREKEARHWPPERMQRTDDEEDNDTDSLNDGEEVEGPGMEVEVNSDGRERSWAATAEDPESSSASAEDDATSSSRAEVLRESILEGLGTVASTTSSPTTSPGLRAGRGSRNSAGGAEASPEEGGAHGDTSPLDDPNGAAGAGPSSSSSSSDDDVDAEDDADAGDDAAPGDTSSATDADVDVDLPPEAKMKKTASGAAKTTSKKKKKKRSSSSSRTGTTSIVGIGSGTTSTVATTAGRKKKKKRDKESKSRDAGTKGGSRTSSSSSSRNVHASMAGSAGTATAKPAAGSSGTSNSTHSNAGDSTTATGAEEDISSVSVFKVDAPLTVCINEPNGPPKTLPTGGDNFNSAAAAARQRVTRKPPLVKQQILPATAILGAVVGGGAGAAPASLSPAGGGRDEQDRAEESNNEHGETSAKSRYDKLYENLLTPEDPLSLRAFYADLERVHHPAQQPLQPNNASPANRTYHEAFFAAAAGMGHAQPGTSTGDGSSSTTTTSDLQNQPQALTGATASTTSAAAGAGGAGPSSSSAATSTSGGTSSSKNKKPSYADENYGRRFCDVLKISMRTGSEVFQLEEDEGEGMSIERLKRVTDEEVLRSKILDVANGYLQRHSLQNMVRIVFPKQKLVCSYSKQSKTMALHSDFKVYRLERFISILDHEIGTHCTRGLNSEIMEEPSWPPHSDLLTNYRDRHFVNNKDRLRILNYVHEKLATPLLEHMHDGSSSSASSTNQLSSQHITDDSIFQDVKKAEASVKAGLSVPSKNQNMMDMLNGKKKLVSAQLDSDGDNCASDDEENLLSRMKNDGPKILEDTTADAVARTTNGGRKKQGTNSNSNGDAASTSRTTSPPTAGPAPPTNKPVIVVPSLKNMGSAVAYPPDPTQTNTPVVEGTLGEDEQDAGGQTGAQNPSSKQQFFNSAFLNSTTAAAIFKQASATYNKNQLSRSFSSILSQHMVADLTQKFNFHRRNATPRERLRSEEGLAALNTHQYYKDKLLWQPAYVYYCVCMSERLSFVELYHHLKRYTADPDLRWRDCVRAKRGCFGVTARKRKAALLALEERERDEWQAKLDAAEKKKDLPKWNSSINTASNKPPAQFLGQGGEHSRADEQLHHNHSPHDAGNHSPSPGAAPAAGHQPLNLGRFVVGGGGGSGGGYGNSYGGNAGSIGGAAGNSYSSDHYGTSKRSSSHHYLEPKQEAATHPPDVLYESCAKDQCYFEGAIEILRRRHELDFEILHAGKLLIRDGVLKIPRKPNQTLKQYYEESLFVEEVEKHNYRYDPGHDRIILNPPLVRPHFLDDLQGYLDRIEKMAEVNLRCRGQRPPKAGTSLSPSAIREPSAIARAMRKNVY